MPVKVPESAAELTAEWFSGLFFEDEQDVPFAAADCDVRDYRPES